MKIFGGQAAMEVDMQIALKNVFRNVFHDFNRHLQAADLPRFDRTLLEWFRCVELTRDPVAYLFVFLSFVFLSRRLHHYDSSVDSNSVMQLLPPLGVIALGVRLYAPFLLVHCWERLRAPLVYQPHAATNRWI